MQTLDLGNVGFSMQGDWSEDTIYRTNEVVRYENALWIARRDTTAGETPGTSASWLLALDGNRVPLAEDVAVATGTAKQFGQIGDAVPTSNLPANRMDSILTPGTYVCDKADAPSGWPLSGDGFLQVIGQEDSVVRQIVMRHEELGVSDIDISFRTIQGSASGPWYRLAAIAGVALISAAGEFNGYYGFQSVTRTSDGVYVLKQSDGFPSRRFTQVSINATSAGIYSCHWARNATDQTVTVYTYKDGQAANVNFSVILF